jgi:hypothetical protein
MIGMPVRMTVATFAWAKTGASSMPSPVSQTMLPECCGRITGKPGLDRLQAEYPGLTRLSFLFAEDRFCNQC